MALLSCSDADAVKALAGLTAANPFKPDQSDVECRVLGAACLTERPLWPADPHSPGPHPNVAHLRARTEDLAAALFRRLADGAAARREELDVYRELVLCLLYLRYEPFWGDLIERSRTAAAGPEPVEWYDAFARDAHQLFSVIPGPGLLPDAEIAHFFALGYQVRRAFHHISRHLFGRSRSAAALRARVWQSIFTHRPIVYRESLFRSLADVPLLITGESGTGKDLVARAVAHSQYIPFDPATKCFAATASAFQVVSLAALSPTVIEAEMFGHRRGAFTGADRDHSGWFESCSPYGAVFLDEIGDLNVDLQVKLLRVAQDRCFQRLGETVARRFEGKLITATNRDLTAGIRARRFREDLFYRLCADTIATPTLRSQLAEAPDDLRHIVAAILRRSGHSTDADALAAEVEAYVHRCFPNHTWPGNIRELEQCTQAFLIRGEYTPPASIDRLDDALRHCRLTSRELVKRYVEIDHAQTGSQRETARRLGIHHRTVRAILDGRVDDASAESLSTEDDPGSW